MLKRTAIRALCNTTAYQRGLDIYRTGKRIQSLDIKSEGAVDKISAAVKGSGRNVYNTGFQYDTEVDRIKEAYCDCPAFRSYSGICKHCVAVLLEYGDRKAYERVEIRRQQDEEQKQAELFSGTAFPAALSGPGQPATKTTVELKSLLNRQLYSRMLPFSGDPYFGRVELETCLKFNSVRNCFTVEFRVGCEKKYILKDVLAFVWNLDHNEKVSYGKNLEFIHSDEAFSEGSRSVLAFIREWVENHHGTYMSRYEQLKDIAVEKVRDLTVDRKELEDLLLILGEKSFKFKMNNDPETTWHSVREIPDRTLMIRKKDQGLSLEIAPVYSVTGIRYHMYFDNAKVYLVSRQELGAVEEFVACLERLPAGRGFIDEPDVPAFVRELLPSLKKFFTVISGISRKKQVLNATRLHMRSIWMHRSVTGSPVRHFLFTGRINFRFLTEMCLPAPGIFRESLVCLCCCQNILTDMMTSGWSWHWIVVPRNWNLCAGKVQGSPTV